ncbi:hypothetical protein CKM354_000560400 [Cercospora kikuchii]|uniref:FAD-binding FR-type domain-containing protein n=1 Tax=Cercospora kikuchii TaxID=84275 RepID=A0A9P3FGZ1_9PEZI|nr:uncharacterized protein CKM354_000560400 [Cercospora kikuchii]GIZ42329.1 hypothetical protein CKM354_000560400 [Cercospora kikuchii]
MSESQHGPPAEEVALIALFKVWQRKNQDTAKYFGVAIAGLMAVFIIGNWSCKLLKRWAKTSSTIRSAYRMSWLISRRLGRAKAFGPLTIWPLQTLLVLVYVGINVTLTFYDRPDKESLSTILAKRFGWMSLCNMCLTIFLVLKNTPLSPLAGYSYDNLNILHRCSGYTVIVFMILHVITYAVGLADAGHLEILDMPLQHAGIVASVAMICMLLTAIGPVRRRMYEAFYASHQLLAATSLVAVGLHRPEITLNALIITIVAAALWFADKSLQLTRWLYRGTGNYCTLVPLSEGATKVIMYRGVKARPGSHAFVWIPGVRLFQRHPFTLVSADPATFVAKARDGFSGGLHEQAYRYPGFKFRASIEGPYGQVPDLHKYDKIVLVAGGSGATFTIALAMQWASKRRTPKDRQTLDFIWIVRHKETQQWFEQELAALRANSRVNLTLFVTSPAQDQVRGKSYESSLSQTSPTVDDLEKGLDFKSLSVEPSVSTRSSDTILRPVTEFGRPDISALLGKSVEGLVERDNVLVAACGPAGMLTDLRGAAIDVQAVAAPMIDVHCEEFSY